jgi:hypothetical protein
MRKQFLFAFFGILLSMSGFAQTPIDLPVTFDNTAVNYNLVDFGGNISSIVIDPVVPTNNVMKAIKISSAALWAGTTIGGPTGMATAIPFAPGSTTMTMRVYSPDAGIPVRMKVEVSGDATKSVETEALTTIANGWEILSFNFANQAGGTAAINFTYSYKMISVFFNFGTEGGAVGEKIYYCDDVEFVYPGPTPLNLPVTFDNSNVNYDLLDFGGNASSIVFDPVVPTNKVGKIIKSVSAATWAGTTIGGTTGGFATAIPFASNATKINMRVYSPDAGIPVRMKVEDPNDPGKSVETEKMTTIANGWETLEFNFANQASGTAAINFSYTYKKMSVFFNFGTEGAVAGEKTYYFDDIAFVPAVPVLIDLPVTFNDTNVNYNLVDFGGNVSSLEADPMVPTNTVCKILKTAGAQTWAGTTIGGSTGMATAIPFVSGATTMTMRVYSPDAGVPVLMKVEVSGAPSQSVETLSYTTMANAWETLTFDFANQSSGQPINFGLSYKVISVFFNFGTSPAEAKTYYCDDIAFGSSGPIPLNLPVTFDNSNVNYNLVDFGGNESLILFDPVVPTNKVCRVIKTAVAEPWAGTTIGGSTGFATAIAFASNATKISMRVFSPDAGITVRMKLEDPSNGSVYVETDKLTTVANAWETLVFNFATPASGSPPINFSSVYKKMSLFFNFGTTGAVAGEKTYYCDDIIFLPAEPIFINVTFQVQNPDSTPVFAFGSWSGWGNWPGNPMTSIGNGFYATTINFPANTNYEFLFVNGNAPWAKEVLDPAWTCTNGNAQYTNRVLNLGSLDTTICLNWNSCNSCVVPVIPANQILQNTTIVSEQGACYNALETITVAGNETYFHVEEFGEATLIAGQNIFLLPGTQVALNAYFHAYITTTGQFCAIPAMPAVKSVENPGSGQIIADDLSLRIFPNPATTEITLDLQGAADGVPAKLEMIGIRGETIRAATLAGNGKHQLSVNGLPAGVYYIRIICGDQVLTKMLLKR